LNQSNRAASIWRLIKIFNYFANFIELTAKACAIDSTRKLEGAVWQIELNDFGGIANLTDLRRGRLLKPTHLGVMYIDKKVSLLISL